MKHSVPALALLLAACGGANSDAPVLDDGAPAPAPPGAPGGGAPTTDGGQGDGPVTLPGEGAPDAAAGEIYPAAISLDSALLVPVPTPAGPPLPANARTIGDVNGDGIDDVAAFYPGTVDVLPASGTVDVLFGTASGTLPGRDALDGNAGFTIEDVVGFVADDDSYRGTVGGVTGVGDVNGDGVGDFAFRDTGYFDLPAWRVVPGAASFAPTLVPVELDDAGLLAKLGRNVELTAAGDIDGDGSSDLVFAGAGSTFEDAAGVLMFGPRGERPVAISLDEMDGAKGVRLPEPYDDPVALDDVDGDGFADVTFGNGRMFAGRARNAASVDGPVVRRADAGFEVFWSATPGADGYRIDVDGAPVAELGAEAREASIDDPTDGAEATLVLEAIAADGTVLSRRQRTVPAWRALENPTAVAQAPRLLEVTFDGDATLERYSRYLVWRDGVPVGRSIEGADNYVDTDVSPGTTYRYFVTPDYLRGESLDASALRDGPLLQRRSAAVEVTTPR